MDWDRTNRRPRAARDDAGSQRIPAVDPLPGECSAGTPARAAARSQRLTGPISPRASSSSRRLPISALPPEPEPALVDEPVAGQGSAGWNEHEQTLDLRGGAAGKILESVPTSHFWAPRGRSDGEGDPADARGPQLGPTLPAGDDDRPESRSWAGDLDAVALLAIGTSDADAPAFDDVTAAPGRPTLAAPGSRVGHLERRVAQQLDAPAARELDRFPPHLSAAGAGPGLKAARALFAFAITVFTLSAALLAHRLLAPSLRGDTPAAEPSPAAPNGHAVGEPRSVAEITSSRAEPPGRKAPAPMVDAAPRPPEQQGVEVVGTTKVTIESIPAARVFANGRALGATPVEMDVKVGEPVPLVLVAKGRRLHRGSVAPKAGHETRLTLELERARYKPFRGRNRGLLRVSCTARDDRRIFLDEQDTGRSCPRAVFALRPGRYRVGFQRLVDGETKWLKTRVKSRRTTKLRLTRY